MTKVKRTYDDWEPDAPNTPELVSEGRKRQPKYREHLFDAKQKAFLREYSELCKKHGMFLSGACGEDDWLYEMPPNALLVCNNKGFDISFSNRREIEVARACNSDDGGFFGLHLEIIFPD